MISSSRVDYKKEVGYDTEIGNKGKTTPAKGVDIVIRKSERRLKSKTQKFNRSIWSPLIEGH